MAKNGQDLLFDVIANFNKPVIAAINGYALGGGLELALACHIRIAAQNAKMGLPEVTLGLIPGYGGTQRLAQLVGKGRAMELIMTAGMIDAETAKSYGLVNHVVPQEELLDLAKSLATKISQNSSVAIAKAIEAINANRSMACKAASSLLLFRPLLKWMTSLIPRANSRLCLRLQHSTKWISLPTAVPKVFM